MVLNNHFAIWQKGCTLAQPDTVHYRQYLLFRVFQLSVAVVPREIMVVKVSTIVCNERTLSHVLHAYVAHCQDGFLEHVLGGKKKLNCTPPGVRTIMFMS